MASLFAELRDQRDFPIEPEDLRLMALLDNLSSFESVLSSWRDGGGMDFMDLLRLLGCK